EPPRADRAGRAVASQSGSSSHPEMTVIASAAKQSRVAGARPSLDCFVALRAPRNDACFPRVENFRTRTIGACRTSGGRPTSQHSADEFRHRLQGRRALVAVGRMTAVGEDEALDRARHLAADALDLLARAVFVAFALDHQGRHLDGGEEFLEVPGFERGIEPAVGPAVEGAVDVGAVMAGELLAQIARAVALARARDR